MGLEMNARPSWKLGASPGRGLEPAGARLEGARRVITCAAAGGRQFQRWSNLQTCLVYLAGILCFLSRENVFLYFIFFLSSSPDLLLRTAIILSLLIGRRNHSALPAAARGPRGLLERMSLLFTKHFSFPLFLVFPRPLRAHLSLIIVMTPAGTLTFGGTVRGGSGLFSTRHGVPRSFRNGIGWQSILFEPSALTPEMGARGKRHQKERDKNKCGI